MYNEQCSLNKPCWFVMGLKSAKLLSAARTKMIDQRKRLKNKLEMTRIR